MKNVKLLHTFPPLIYKSLYIWPANLTEDSLKHKMINKKDHIKSSLFDNAAGSPLSRLIWTVLESRAQLDTAAHELQVGVKL